jgi:hypothetical protein
MNAKRESLFITEAVVDSAVGGLVALVAVYDPALAVVAGVLPAWGPAALEPSGHDAQPNHRITRSPSDGGKTSAISRRNRRESDEHHDGRSNVD